MDGFGYGNMVFWFGGWFMNNKLRDDARLASQKFFCEKYGFDEDFFVWFERARYGTREPEAIKILVEEGFLNDKI